MVVGHPGIVSATLVGQPIIEYMLKRLILLGSHLCFQGGERWGNLCFLVVDPGARQDAWDVSVSLLIRVHFHSENVGLEPFL